MTSAVSELVDSAVATDRLQAAGYDIVGAEPNYIRHKPGETTIVAYRLALRDGGVTWGYALWCDDAARAEQIHQKAATLRPRPSTAGPGLARLDSRTVFYAFPNDARLRRLRWYTDPRKLKRSLHGIIDPVRRVSGSRTTVDVLRYKPERRVVARVDLATKTHTQPLLVRYSTRRQAGHLSRVAGHLRARGIDTPAPIAQLDDDRVAVDEYIDGNQLRDSIRAGTIDPESLALAIARFHSTTPPPATPERSAAGDLARAIDGLSGLSAWDGSLAESARATAGLLSERLPERSGPSVLLHGDLHSKNVLVSCERIAFIDLERVAVGPAAIDLGFFNAHSIALGVRQPGWSPDAADHAGAAIDAYMSFTGADPSADVAWHTALGLVEQALLVARHIEGGWQHTSSLLLDAARRQLHPARTITGACHQ